MQVISSVYFPDILGLTTHYVIGTNGITHIDMSRMERNEYRFTITCISEIINIYTFMPFEVHYKNMA